jgi:hypothetical protein
MRGDKTTVATAEGIASAGSGPHSRTTTRPPTRIRIDREGWAADELT